MTLRSSLFRPCIDLHDGQVKQIVGGTLSEKLPESLKTNFVATYAHHALIGLLISDTDRALECLLVYTNNIALKAAML